MARTPVGSVAIKSNHSRLQLVFRYRGKREYISLGLPDTKANRTYARTIAGQIEMDILAGNYDTTQQRYKAFGTEPAPTKNTQILLGNLWEKYVEYKHSQVSTSTIANTYRQVERWLERMPYKRVEDAIAIRAHLLKHTTTYTTNRVLNNLNACCKWALESKLIASNPFEGLARGLNKPSKDEIEYFTESERSGIIQYFKDYDPHYAPLVEFMFRTGCRPSEAAALEWGDISSEFDRICFVRALTKAEYGSTAIVKDGLKTQKQRIVPCGQTLTAFLVSIAPIDRTPTDLVFPSPKIGSYIHLGNFTKRHWNPALKVLGFKHRSFYKVRHTAITHALDTLDAKDVAALVGNSADVIYKKYAGIREDLKTPDF